MPPRPPHLSPRKPLSVSALALAACSVELKPPPGRPAGPGPAQGAGEDVRPLKLLIVAALLLVGCGEAGSMAADPPPDWGTRSWATFTTVVDSEGAVVPGLGPPQWRLPAFVHADGSEARGALSVEGSFTYLGGLAAGARANVELGLTGGRLDAWYPDAENGDDGLRWDPIRAAEQTLEALDGDERLFTAARAVPSTLIGSGQQAERFLFARGASDAAPPLSVEAHGLDGYRLTSGADEEIPRALVLRRHAGGWLIWPVTALEPGQSIELDSPPPKERDARVARALVVAELASMLTGAGLGQEEVTAVLEIWGETWIDVPGVRVVFLAPAGWASRLMPLSAPGAASSYRAVLGRVEAMTPEVEEELLRDLRASIELSAPFDSRSLGRFAVPMLIRAAQLSEERGDAELNALCEVLLADIVGGGGRVVR